MHDLRDILAGVVFEFNISQMLLIAFLTLVAIPSLMVMFSMMLPARANRTKPHRGIAVRPRLDVQRGG